MRILVTGGFGFIGAHLVEALLNKGERVRILDSHVQDDLVEAFRKKYKKNFEVLIGDIRDLDVCMDACRGIKVVFHTAAISSIPVSFQDPQKTYDVNVRGTKKLLKACVKSKVKRLVFSSSGKIYGNSKEFPSKENDLLDPTTPYAVTKFEAEKICEQYAQESPLEVITLRYFSIYGPRQRLYGGLIADILGNVLNRGSSVIHATDTMERDFTYVGDVVKANLLCREYKYKGYTVFNIGSGKSYTIPDLIRIVQDFSRKKVHIKYKELLEGTTIRTRADISRAKKLLGFYPQMPLDEGLYKTFKWFKNENVIIRSKYRKKKVIAVILTGGSGTRIRRAKLPKQFIKVAGNPLFVHCLKTYEKLKEVDEICLVINKNYEDLYEKILKKLKIKKLKHIAYGGKYRHQSIENALAKIDTGGFMVLQNGASPVTQAELIRKCIKAAKNHGAVSAFVPASHTVFVKDDRQIRKVLDRQTIGYTCDPQVYETSILVHALKTAKKMRGGDVPTVDAITRLGTPVHLVESDMNNLKVTTDADIRSIEYLLKKLKI